MDAVMNPVKRIGLAYKDGSSDKVYNVWMREVGPNQFMVEFTYGRRGSTLTAGSKTTSPVSLAAAEKIFDKLIKEKQAKGYSPEGEGTPFAGTDKAGEVSGLVPQLLNSIDTYDNYKVTELIQDVTWFMQEKMDGFHQMARIDGDVTISNRKGLIVPGSSKIVEALKALNGPRFDPPYVLDGESIGDVYHVFDILMAGGKSLREKGALGRYLALDVLMTELNSPSVVKVRTALNSDAKRKLYAEIVARRGEGVVFKKDNAVYVPGRPNSGGNMLKLKFKASATLYSNGPNKGARSVLLFAQGPTPDQKIAVGNVTIPINHDIPPSGTLVEVEYLYAYKGGSLFQPVFKGRRTDKDSADNIDSLKLKADSDEDSQ